LRTQEFYESPQYKGKIFTLKEYKVWYLKHFDVSKFDYWQAYTAYNLPDYAFNPFIEGKFNPLTKNEKYFIDQVKDLPRPFAIIGLNIKDEIANIQLCHETAHGLFYIHKEYKDAMTELASQIPQIIIKKIHGELKRIGYHPDVYIDETQAYIVDGEPLRLYFGDISKKLLNNFHSIFKKYCDVQKLDKQIEMMNNEL